MQRKYAQNRGVIKNNSYAGYTYHLSRMVSGAEPLENEYRAKLTLNNCYIGNNISD
ncbi:hypothetical protein [Methanosphaera sp. BMS]|uniref:hypothetical protein n=1 Tax=Methanosphaera sp. BMS TaxID=1789762 RepID=UPI0013A6909A|nr:hypothetical protein [Methanosphaera sp. BMS]